MQPTTLRPLRRWRYRIFAVTWVAYAGFYLCRKNFSVLMPLLQADLGYSKIEFANVIFGYSLLYALGQFVAGPLSDRFGPRLIVGLGLLIAIGSNLAMAFGASLALLAVLSCVNGAGQASGWSGLVKNMAWWFPHEQRGVVMAWWSTNYVLGGFLATVFATFVATQGWRRGFWAPALLLTPIALGFVLLVRNKPSDAGLLEVDGPEPLRRGDIRLNRAVWILAAACFFSKMTRYAFLFWLPLYMTDHLHYAAAEAGYTSSLFELIGFSGAVIAGYVSDKLMQSRRFPVGAMMLWGLAIACLLHPALARSGRLGNALGISLIGILTYGPDTLIQGAAAQDAGGPRGAATAAGFISGVGSLGQLFSPYLVAWVAQKHGWDNLFYLLVVFSILGGCLMASKWNYQREVGIRSQESEYRIPRTEDRKQK